MDNEEQPKAHRYEVDDPVTLQDGRQGIIVSLWWEDSGAPGYGVRFRDGSQTGVVESHIWSLTDGSGA